MTTKLALAIAALTTIGTTAHAAVNKDPSKLCKTDSGSCSYVCGYFDQSGCTLIKGSCNPNVGIIVYQPTRYDGYSNGATTAQPDVNSPSWVLFCKELVPLPPDNHETPAQRIHRLFGKSVGKSVGNSVKHIGKKSRK